MNNQVNDDELDSIIAEANGVQQGGDELDSIIAEANGTLDNNNTPLDSEAQRQEIRNENLPEASRLGATMAAMVPGGAAIGPIFTKDEVTALNDNMRTYRHNDGAVLEDGKTYSDGKGEYYRFDYDKAKEGGDPRIPVSKRDYETEHDEPETDDLKVKKQRENARNAANGVSAYLEKQFGGMKGKIHIAPEDLPPTKVEDLDKEGKALAGEVAKYNSMDLDHAKRPMHIFRDENGKVTGYGTTESVVVPEPKVDGDEWSVVPSIVDDNGKTRRFETQEEAAEYYRTHGEQKWGTFKTEEEAKQAADKIHQLHAKMYQNKWDQYKREHWDELSDEIKADKDEQKAQADWEAAGKPIVEVDVEEMRGAGKKAENALHGERGVAEDIIKSAEAEQGVEKTLGGALTDYLTPFLTGVRQEQKAEKQNRYERYMNGEMRDEDLKLDPELRSLLANTYEDKGEVAKRYGAGMLEEMTRVSEEANKFLANTELPWYKTIVSGGAKNAGYTGAFALSAAMGGAAYEALQTVTGIAIPAASAAAQRYAELTTNEYGIGEDGSLQISALADDAGEAAAKAVVGGVMESVVERYLEKLGGVLPGKGIARNIRGVVLDKMATSKWLAPAITMAQGYGWLKKYTGLGGIGWEIAEEYAQDIVDTIVGVNSKSDSKSGLINGGAEGVKKAWAEDEMFTWKGLGDTALNMVGTMIMQGAAGAVIGDVANRDAKGKMHEYAQSIYDIPGLDRRVLDTMSDYHKTKFLNFYNKHNGDPVALNKYADKLFGVNGAIRAVARQAANREGAQMRETLEKRGIAPESFSPAVDENGNIIFETQTIDDKVLGIKGNEKVATDEEHGVAIADAGEGVYCMIDTRRGTYTYFDNLDDAIQCANRRVIVNQTEDADNQAKIARLNETAKDSGVEVIYYTDRRSSLNQFPAQDGKPSMYDQGVPMVRVGNKVHVILDNIQGPAQMENAFKRVTSGMKRGETSVTGAELNDVQIAPVEVEQKPERSVERRWPTHVAAYPQSEDVQEQPEERDYSAEDELAAEEEAESTGKYVNVKSPVEFEALTKGMTDEEKAAAEDEYYQQNAEHRKELATFYINELNTKKFAAITKKGEVPETITKAEHLFSLAPDTKEGMALRAAIDAAKKRIADTKANTLKARNAHTATYENFRKSVANMASDAANKISEFDALALEQINDRGYFLNIPIGMRKYLKDLKDWKRAMKNGTKYHGMVATEINRPEKANVRGGSDPFWDAIENFLDGTSWSDPMVKKLFGDGLTAKGKEGGNDGDFDLSPDVEVYLKGIYDAKGADGIISWFMKVQGAFNEWVASGANRKAAEEEYQKTEEDEYQKRNGGDSSKLNWKPASVEASEGEIQSARDEALDTPFYDTFDPAKVNGHIDINSLTGDFDVLPKKINGKQYVCIGVDKKNGIIDLISYDDNKSYEFNTFTNQIREVERGNPEGETIGIDSEEETAQNGEGTEAETGDAGGSKGVSDAEMRSAYKCLTDEAYAKAHPEENERAQKLLEAGVPISCVNDNDLEVDDKVSWPVTGVKVNTKEDVVNLFRKLSNSKREISKVLYFDKNGNIIGGKILAFGTLNSSPAGNKAVFANMPEGTYGIVYSHNHPSGNVIPSGADILCSRKLQEQCKDHGIIMLDDIVTDTTEYYSLFSDSNKIRFGEDEKAFWKQMGIGNKSVVSAPKNFNIVPSDERKSLIKTPFANNIAAIASTHNKQISYAVGIGTNGTVAYIVAIPENGNVATYKELFGKLGNADNIALVIGSKPFNHMALAEALGKVDVGRDHGLRISAVYSSSANKMLAENLDLNADSASGNWLAPNKRFGGMSIKDVFLPEREKVSLKPAEKFDSVIDKPEYTFTRSGDQVYMWGGKKGIGETIKPLGFKWGAVKVGKEWKGVKAWEIPYSAIPDGSGILRRIDESKDATARMQEAKKPAKKAEVSVAAHEELANNKVKSAAFNLDVEKEKAALTAEFSADDILGEIREVYTGSAADYDKPSLHAVGTGEGAQVYGWGLYGSTERGVADNYSYVTRSFVVNGEKVTPNPKNRVENRVLDILKETHGDYEVAIKALAYAAKMYQDSEENQEYRDAINYLKEKHPTLPSRYVYSQTFFTNRAPGDESHLLKWSNPIDDVAFRAFKKALKILGVKLVKRELPLQYGGTKYKTTIDRNGKDSPIRLFDKDDYQGTLYMLLADATSPKEASEAFVKAGIDGVKYPVDSYGGKTVKDGDKAGWNYVSFRDDNIRVDHKWVDGEQRFEERATGKFKDNFGFPMFAIQVGGVFTKAHGDEAVLKAGLAKFKTRLENWQAKMIKSKDALPDEAYIDKAVSYLRRAGNAHADDVKKLLMKTINAIHSERGDAPTPEYFWGVGGQGEFWHMYGVEPNGQMTLFEAREESQQSKKEQFFNKMKNLSNTFFGEDRTGKGEGTTFKDYVKYMDAILAPFGEKVVNALKNRYPSWYNAAAIEIDGKVAHDSSGEVDRQFREMQGFDTDEGEDAPGHRVPVIVQRTLIPEPKNAAVNNQSYNGGLDKYQQQGVNLALEAIGKTAGSFMLADGTGFGKTRQILAIADQFAKGNPNAHILILTKNREIINDSFTRDAGVMGVDLNNFTLGTYNDLSKGSFEGYRWNLVLLDEAHLLSNSTSKRAIAYWQLGAEHFVFATATPMDRPTDAAYFLAKLNNADPEALAQRMGYTISWREGKNNSMYQVAVPVEGADFDSIRHNLILERDKAIAEGKFLRRTYPFLGEVKENKSKISPEHANNEGAIQAFTQLAADATTFQSKIYLRSVGQVLKREDYAQEQWDRIVANKHKEINEDKIRYVDSLNESMKADDAVALVKQIIEKDPKARIIIAGSQVGEHTIDGGFSNADISKKMNLTGLKQALRNGRIKYLIEPSLKRVERGLAALGYDKFVSRIYGGRDKRMEQNAFLSNIKPYLVMTGQSGGTGLNLDDTSGNHPTYMIILTKDYSAKEVDQLLGRISRKTTMSPATAIFLTNNSYSDTHRGRVTNSKAAILAASRGDDVDISGDFSNRQREDGDERNETRAENVDKFTVAPTSDVHKLLMDLYRRGANDEEVRQELRATGQMKQSVDEKLKELGHDPFYDGETDKHGMESSHVIRKGDMVYKFRKPDNTQDMELENVANFNALFPEEAYAVEGVLADGTILLKQRYVNLDQKRGDTARKEILTALNERFGKAEMRGNEIQVGGWDIDDLKDANIGYDKDSGKPVVIDARIHRLSDMPENLRWNDDERNEIREVYTGSAADYDKPSLHAVGTGEGSQVYGWGLYGSSVRGVAEGYAAGGQSNHTVVMVDGKEWKPSKDAPIGERTAYEQLDDLSNTPEEIAEYCESQESERYKEAAKFIRSHKIEIRDPHNYLYSQTFFTNRAPGDESHLLSWYEPVSEENLQRIYKQAKKENIGTPDGNDVYVIGGYDFVGVLKDGTSIKSESLYNEIAFDLGSPKAASEFLARAGIDGVKYPVDSYGVKPVKDGDKAGWNYVSFRDDNIRVDHKWVDGEQRFEERPPMEGEVDDERLEARGVPYQGSKSRIADRIVGTLPGGKRFVDLFSGGGAVTHAAMLSGKYGAYRMNDLDGNAQQLFVNAVNGKYDDYENPNLTPEQFAQIKGTPEAYMLSFNGIGRSLAKKDENRDKAQEQIDRVKRLSALKGYAKDVEASRSDYRLVKLRKGDVVYADIPYENTDTRGYGSGRRFDRDAFMAWAQRQKVPVYVSEYAMPDGWSEIASFTVSGMRGGERTEKLFVQDKFAGERRESRVTPAEDAAYADAVKQYADALEEQRRDFARMDEIADEWSKRTGKHPTSANIGNVRKNMGDEYADLNDKWNSVKANIFEQLEDRFGEKIRTDAEYADAMKRGDKETALRMIREAAAKAGYDKEVWHYGSYSMPDTPNFGMHFGTLEAARDRSRDIDIDNGWFTHGFFNANKALRLDDHGEWDSNTILGQLHSIYWQDGETRNKINSIRTKENGRQKDNATRSLLNALGYHGIVYQNKYEDYGKDSYVVTNPENVKSADITYDDAGNLIPLSKRFNEDEDDIRYEEREEGDAYHNAAVMGYNNAHGIGSRFSKTVQTDDEVAQQVETMRSNPVEFENFVDDIIHLPENVPPNSVQQAAIGVALVQAERAYDEMFMRRKDLFDAGNIADAMEVNQQMQPLFERLMAIEEANTKLGTAEGRVFRARRFTVADDYSVVRVLTRASEAKRSALSPDQREFFEKLVSKYRDAQIALTDARRADLELMLDSLIKDWAIGFQRTHATKQLSPRTINSIERSYREACRQIRFHLKKTGGLIGGLPEGKKWLNAIQAYHIMKGDVNGADGKVDAKKIILAVKAEIEKIAEDNGMVASVSEYQIRQIITSMGNSIKPSPDAVSIALRDVNSQHLAQQQIAYIMKYDELPPKTGFLRDPQSLAVRTLIKQRNALIKAKGLNAANEAGKLKSALDAMKTRMRNRIEELKKAIADNKELQKASKNKVALDVEAQALKDELEHWNEVYAALHPKSESEKHEEAVIRAIAALKRAGEKWLRDIDALQNNGIPREGAHKLVDPRLEPYRQMNAKFKKDYDNLMAVLFPNGTAAQIQHDIELKLKHLTKEAEALQKRLDEANAANTWQAKMDALRGGKKHEKKTYTSDKVLKAEADKAKLKEDIDREIKKLEEENIPMRKVRGLLNTAANILPRAINAGYDLSYALRQGYFAALNNPAAAWDAFVDSLKSFASESNDRIIRVALENDPFYQDFKEHGGRLYGRETGRPDEYAGGIGETIVGKIPGVKESERSFSTYLNAMNVAFYKALVMGGEFGSSGPNEAQRKVLAEAVSTFTGSSKQDRTGTLASLVFFAPRYALSTAKLAIGWPMVAPFFRKNAKGEEGMGSKEFSTKERAQVAWALAKPYATAITAGVIFNLILSALAGLLDGDDDHDRWEDFWSARSPDFLAARFGNTRINILKPITNWWTLMGRMAGGKTTSHGITRDRTISDIIGRTERGKFSPVVGLAADIMEGKDYNGNVIDWGKFTFKGKGEKRISGLLHVLETFMIPLTMSDAKTIYDNDGLVEAVALTPLVTLGISASSYNDHYERTIGRAMNVNRELNSAMGNANSGIPPNIEEVNRILHGNPKAVKIGKLLKGNDDFKSINRLERQAATYEKMGMTDMAEKLREQAQTKKDAYAKFYDSFK